MGVYYLTEKREFVLSSDLIDSLPFLTVCELSEIIQGRIYVAFEAFANKRQYIKIKCKG